MKLAAFKDRNGAVILLCIIGILLVYLIDIPKLVNWFTSWQTFGKPPIQVSEIQYFVPDVSSVTGFKDQTSGDWVSCESSVVYVKTDADKTYQCCDMGAKIYCLAGDFLRDIPSNDPTCTSKLKKMFGTSDTIEDSKYYNIFSSCRRSDDWDIEEITIVKIDNHEHITWKFLSAFNIEIITFMLKCVLTTLILIIGIIIIIAQSKVPVHKS